MALARVTSRGKVSNNAICVLLAFALVANVIPYFRGETFEDAVWLHDAALSWQIVSIAALMLAAILFGRFQIGKNETLRLAAGPFTSYLFLNSLVSESLDISLLYTGTFLFVIMLIGIIRLAASDWLRVFRFTSLLLVAMVIFLISTKTLVDRYVGAIHPNMMGTWILVMAILATAWQNWLRWFIFIVALVVGFMVESRFSCLAVLLFVASFEFLITVHTPRRVLMFIIAIGFIGLVAGSAILTFVEGEGPRSLAEGGISGRVDLWDESSLRISEHPFFGSGFRSTLVTYDISHSGFLTLCEELGMVGIGLFFVLITVRGAELIRAHRCSDGRDTQRLCSILVAGLIADIVPFAFQPNYLNFGDPLGLLILLILFLEIRSPSKTETDLRSIPLRGGARQITDLRHGRRAPRRHAGCSPKR
jgi:hypothetical protein